MGRPDARPLTGICVLVVDDNSDSLDLLESTLTYHGALTLTAGDGKEALARLAHARVDVIVSDISMPGFSGTDFIRAVRASPGAIRNIPAIALTALNEPLQRRHALEAGFQVYVLKPFDLADLLRTIVQLAGQSPER